MEKFEGFRDRLLMGLAIIFAALTFWGLGRLFVGTAWAADGTTVTLAPLVDELLSGLATAALAGLLWLINRAAEWLKLRSDSEVRRYLEQAAYAGIALARSKASGALDGRLSIDVKSAMAAEVGQYLVDRVPAALRRFGLTGDALSDYILARIPDASDAGGVLTLPASAALR